MRRLPALGALVLAAGALVPGVSAAAHPAPRPTQPPALTTPDPGPRALGPRALPGSTRPVPMPHARPRGLPPVPIPHVRPQRPGPVPMPLVGEPSVPELRLPPRQPR